VVQYLVNGPEWNVQTRVQQPIVAQKKIKKKTKHLYTKARSYVYVISTKKSDSSDIPWSKINRYG
jgi:hypothetical protein